jgi:hypothetical protein
MTLRDRLLEDRRTQMKSALWLILLAVALASGCQSRQSEARAPQSALLFPEQELYGDYYFGDGLGVNCSLTIKANHRFAFRWTGCLGTYDENQGSWALSGDILTLKPEKPNDLSGFQGTNTRFIPVKWAGKHYLVDEYEMPGFCAMARSVVTHPRNSHFVLGSDYRKQEDDKTTGPAAEMLIPGRFREFYDKGAVAAKAVRIDGNQVVLDRGSADRVKPGMLLAHVDYLSINLTVVSVEEHQSIAKPIYFWNSDRRVKVGDRFTTGEEFGRPRGTGFKRYDSPPPPEKPAKKGK